MAPRLLIGALLALALLAAPAHAADLRATAGKPPAQLKAGDPLSVTVTTRNAAGRRAPKSRSATSPPAGRCAVTTRPRTPRR